MFQFTGFPSVRYGLAHGYMGGAHVGCPIQKSAAHDGYLPLAAAFRSLSRLSSALSAKASALCSLLLNYTGTMCQFIPGHMAGFSTTVPAPSVAWGDGIWLMPKYHDTWYHWYSVSFSFLGCRSKQWELPGFVWFSLFGFQGTNIPLRGLSPERIFQNSGWLECQHA